MSVSAILPPSPQDVCPILTRTTIPAVTLRTAEGDPTLAGAGSFVLGPEPVLLLADGAEGQKQLAHWVPLLANVTRKQGRETAYICEN